MTRRIGFGLLTIVLIGAALGLAPSIVPEAWAGERFAGYFYIWPGVEGAGIAFLATLGGAYVARVPFIIPAALFATVSWILIVSFLSSIAAGTGQGDILTVAGSNALGLLLGIVGAVAGAYLGGRLSTLTKGGIAEAA